MKLPTPTSNFQFPSAKATKAKAAKIATFAKKGFLELVVAWWELRWSIPKRTGRTRTRECVRGEAEEAEEERGKMLKWEEVLSDSWMKVYRAKVPGGWFVFTYWGANYAGQAFYPDPNHQWDGTSPS